MKGWVGVDFDGTLAEYHTGRKNHLLTGVPIAPMVARVKRWLADGHEVRIVTARVSGRDGYELEEQRSMIAAWCVEHLGKPLKIQAEKDYGMRVLFDDRAVGVENNTGRILSPLPAWLSPDPEIT